MSEHKHNTSRYWRRNEPDDNDVYFMTESNAAHSRAEGDPRAREIDQEQYEAMVPAEARGKPYNVTEGRPAGEGPSRPPVDVQAGGETVEIGAAMYEAVVNQYKHTSLQTMMAAHTKIRDFLLMNDLTHAERIFILKMVETELMASMMAPVQVPNT